MKQEIPLARAVKVATSIIKKLSKYGNIEICGSIRRRKAVVGDIDLVGDNQEMLYKLLKLGTSTMSGSAKQQIIVDGIQVDFRLSNEDSWGTSIMMWTGSKQENIRLRSIAKNKGMLLNEYGLNKNGKNIAKGKSEEEIYELLGQEYKIPEKR